MKIIFAADDEAPTVEAVRKYLRAKTKLVEIKGSNWVEIAREAARGVADGKADYAVLLCWTGTGVAMVANKVSGVRAATAWEPWIATHARLWNDANVLTMSLKRTDPEEAVEIVKAFLAEVKPDADELDNIRQIEP